jgi:hypothetical protein
MAAGLKSRLDRLEHRLGMDAPRRAIVFFGPGLHRHSIARGPGFILRLTVPCPRDGDPIEHLSAEQRTLIDRVDSVSCFEAAENPRDPSALSDDGQDEP